MTLNLAEIFGPEVAQVNTPSTSVVPENPLVVSEVHTTEPSERVSTDTLPKFPDKINESESTTLCRLCSPNPAAEPSAAPRCDRCHSAEFVDYSIHNGQSTRRDCARCGRFIDFPRWYETDNTESPQVSVAIDRRLEDTLRHDNALDGQPGPDNRAGQTNQ